MWYQQVLVDETTALPATVLGAHALWEEVFRITSVHEDDREGNPRLARQLVEEYGPFAERRQNGIEWLVEYYLEHFGDEGAALIREHWGARTLSWYLPPEGNPLYVARNKLRRLHGGLIVDDYRLYELGGRLPSGRLRPFAFFVPAPAV